MADDYAAMLAFEQGNPNAILLQILGDNYEDWNIIVAVEGPDDRCFYFDFIKEFHEGQMLAFFECGGKERLLQFRTAAESYVWRTKPRILYICDKDFDDYLAIYHDGVFKTDVYSIESYFSGAEFVEYVVDKYCLRPLTRTERSVFMERFLLLFQSFIRPLRMVSAFMCEVRASGCHPQFDECGIDKLFELGGDKGFRKVRVLSMMRQVFAVEPPINYSTVLARARAFEKRSYKSWLRGKLAFQVTRKVYDIARSGMADAVKQKLPASTFFGSDAFRIAKPFLGSVPGLQEYCR